MKLLAVYFSGTGNTKYAVQRLLKGFDGSSMHSVEELLDFENAADGFDTILVAFPIYGSDMPGNMREFIEKNRAVFIGKKLITLVTQLLFSGDGGRLAYRLLREEIDEHTASIHINMPTNISFPPIFAIKNGADIDEKMEKANRKIDRCAVRLKAGQSIKDGRGPLAFLVGFLGQRMWYRAFFVNHYKKKLQIDAERCTGCGLCVQNCPVNNLVFGAEQVMPQNKCILCVRCINQCPQQAITLLSKSDAYVQYKGPFII